MECCKQEMRTEQSYFNGEDATMNVCLECGGYHIVKTGVLDEEELLEYGGD